MAVHTSSERFANSAAADALSSSKTYADAKITAAITALDVDGKIATAISGFAEQINANRIAAAAADAKAVTAQTTATAASATATTAKNAADTAAGSVATEKVSRENADIVLASAIDGKQATLVSGSNIKTINGNSVLGSGNLVIEGTGGTSDYEQLTNKPKIASTELTGNKSLSDLGIASASALAAKQDTISDLATIRSGAAAGATAYQLPTGGIPSTDMTAAVTTSLGKADSAYQLPAGGITTTDLASGVVTSLGKADTAYQKPSTGVPLTDLNASDIFSNSNTSLNLDNVRVSASVATSAKSYIDGIVGTINTALDTLNGEVA